MLFLRRILICLLPSLLWEHPIRRSQVSFTNHKCVQLCLTFFNKTELCRDHMRIYVRAHFLAGNFPFSSVIKGNPHPFALCLKPYLTLAQNRLELVCLGVLTIVSLASLELIPDPLEEFTGSVDQVRFGC